jgi:hypothetical protein
MRDLDLFQQALGLDEPWRVVATYFDPERRHLDLFWRDQRCHIAACCARHYSIDTMVDQILVALNTVTGEARSRTT